MKHVSKLLESNHPWFVCLCISTNVRLYNTLSVMLLLKHLFKSVNEKRVTLHYLTFMIQVKALNEKNQRDLQQQMEQEERHVSIWNTCILIISPKLCTINVNIVDADEICMKLFSNIRNSVIFLLSIFFSKYYIKRLVEEYYSSAVSK